VPTDDADLIIAGAGCAGLSALWYAIQAVGADRRIVVVDRDLAPSDDRTWSFWGTSTAPFAHLADGRWAQMRVAFPTWATTQPVDPRNRGGADGRNYYRVRRRDYDREILDMASAAPNVMLLQSDVLDVRDDARGGVVSLPEGELRAPLVLQSLMPATADDARPVRHPLRQHFGGWEVVTQHPVFDPGTVTLMDFDTAQHGETAFFYVLPEARDRALVEFTVFSPEPRGRASYDQRIADHLARLGAGDVDVVRTEYGVIPMEDRTHTQRSGDHVWNIGTAGGRTKPSTGYTFQRIHDQARRAIHGWATTGAPEPVPEVPRRYRFADRALLNILHHHPDRGRPIFERLFATSTIADVLTFLDEDTSLVADAKMLGRLPWPPFLRAAAVEAAASARHLLVSHA
jgi:lycopene beta-cyclase